MQNRTLARIVEPRLGDAAQRRACRRVINRNDLVARYKFVDGVKTGHTNDAGLRARRRGARQRREGDQRGARHALELGARDSDSLALLR